MPTIDVNGLTMYYEFHGEPAAPPLVFICGMRLDVSEIQPLLGELARGYRVLAFDNRGAGRTDKPDAPYTIPMMAADTAALMRAVGMPHAAVLGLSMGGRIALSLALDAPGTVTRLILVSTAA
ncbi:MAG TPA: alpha/beta fold hydrolase, partial [Micromonosporaceae bacterium]